MYLDYWQPSEQKVDCAVCGIQADECDFIEVGCHLICEHCAAGVNEGEECATMANVKEWTGNEWERWGVENSRIFEAKYFGDGIVGYVTRHTDTSDGRVRWGWFTCEYGTSLTEIKDLYLFQGVAREKCSQSAKRSVRYRRKRREQARLSDLNISYNKFISRRNA